MALTIVFPSVQFEERLRMEAERRGMTPEDFVVRILTDYLDSLEEGRAEFIQGAGADQTARQ